MVRNVRQDELADLIRLYRLFHPEEAAADPEAAATRKVWQDILADPNLRYYGVEADGRIVSTCTLTLIPNLNHGLKPYGLLENVVTDPGYRKRGFATLAIQHALGEAWAAGCYKVMLLTGSQNEGTLRFYENAGLQRGVKTGFIAFPSQK
jgi:GNAT superfamily N-acetyltransferase